MNVTNQEAELLTILMEECAEVIQACSKIQRFGWEGATTADDSGNTNRDHLATELGDLAAVANKLGAEGRLSSPKIHAATEAKYEKMKKFTTHQHD